MAFLEGLKKIIPARIAEESYDFELKITSAPPNAKTNFKVEKSNKLIILYLDKLTVKEKNILKNHLKKNFEENKINFVTEDSLELLEKLIKYNKEDDGSTLTFFEGILTKHDYYILRASLFLREEYLKDQNVSGLKSDISAKYGERGNIICNLCTAGYFEEIMIPLWNDDEKEFYKFYDLAVERGVKALFVNKGMTVEQITQEITRRIESAKSSGLKSINIHGLGETNVNNILKSLEKIEKKGGFVRKNIIQRKQVVIVEIILS